MTDIRIFLLQQPVIALHLMAALSALVLGSAILWRRKGTRDHRALGWVWVALMAITTVTSVFMRDFGMLNLWGYTPIHVFTVVTAVALPAAVWAARRGDVRAHRLAMRGLYFGGCVAAGLGALAPGRMLALLVWQGV